METTETLPPPEPSLPHLVCGLHGRVEWGDLALISSAASGLLVVCSRCLADATRTPDAAAWVGPLVLKRRALSPFAAFRRWLFSPSPTGGTA